METKPNFNSISSRVINMFRSKSKLSFDDDGSENKMNVKMYLTASYTTRFGVQANTFDFTCKEQK